MESTQGRRKARFGADGGEVFARYKEYDATFHYNPDELRGRVLVASLGEFWYTPGWPAASTSAPAPAPAPAMDAFGSSFSLQQQQQQSTASSRRQLQTYYHNAKLDFRLSLDGDDGVRV